MKSNWCKIHTGPYNAGIKQVWNSDEQQMLKEMKLVQNTHWSLQCWYRTSLVFRRKTNANRNQTGTKYTLLLTMLVQNRSGIQKKTNGNRNQTGKNIYTHPSLQRWYRTSLVFRKKQMRTGVKLEQKYTLVPTMLVQNQSGIQMKNKC